MQLYFVRHAQSTNNALWERTGSSNGRHSDPELSSIGEQQIHHLARNIAHTPLTAAADPLDLQNRNGFHLTHIYTSLMVRAVKTGVALASACGLPLIAWEELHELGGIYLADENTGEPSGLPGKDRDYFVERYPELVLPDTFKANGWWQRPFEHEDERSLRAWRVLDRLTELHVPYDHRVALVSHGGFYDLLMKTILNIPLDESRWFTLNNTGITRLDMTPEWVSVVYQNRVSHLPPDLIT